MRTKRYSNIKNVIRVTALLIIAAFLITTYTPIQADAASLKEEVVYVRLNNDGSLIQVYVVNSFQLGHDNEILDYGNYEYVRNLTDSNEIKLENGKVTVEANGDQLYYEGLLMNPQLPWNFSIKYMLDGKEISSEELAGKSGHLVIKLETGANPLGNKEFYNSYALQIAFTFDSSISKNITAKGGTVASAGSNKQVNYVVLPGSEASFDIGLDINSFEMPAITIAGVRLNIDFDLGNYDMSELNQLTDGIADLDDGVQELLDGIFDMKKGVSELHGGTIDLGDGVGEFKDGIKGLTEGTDELKDGVKELKGGTSEMTDGAIKLVDGTNELVDGVRKLDDGVGEFADGVGELYYGVEELLLGISKLNGGMIEITDGSAELKSGANALASGAASAAGGGGQLAGGFSQYFDGIIALVNSQLASSPIPGLPLTRENYSNVLENALYGQAIAMAREEIKTQVNGAARQQILEAILAQYGMTIEQYNLLPEANEIKIQIGLAVNAQLSIMENELIAKVEAVLSEQMTSIRAIVDEAIINMDDTEPAKQLYGLLEILKGYDQLLTGLNQYVSGVNGISTGVGSYSAGVSKFHDGLVKYQDGLSDYQSGMAQFYKESHKLVDGANELKEGTVGLLDGVIELKNGVVEFKDGMIELRDGVIELFDGIVELHDGVIKMNDGAIELNDGVIELIDGVGGLKDGTNDLFDGVSELKDGTGELRRETGSLDSKIIDVVKEEIDKMMGGNAPAKSFVSEKNGEVSAVQFVMQIEGISIPEVVEVIPEPEPKLTFWQRFIRLFGL